MLELGALLIHVLNVLNASQVMNNIVIKVKLEHIMVIRNLVEYLETKKQKL
jgi:hypothetical protein